MTDRHASIFRPDGLKWKTVDVRGTAMLEARVMNGEENIYSAYYRLPKGTEIQLHQHINWVQVMVVQGEMSVVEDGISHVISAGGCYVVPAGGRHTERSNVDTLVLVTSPDP